jgi:hypothetical protein
MHYWGYVIEQLTHVDERAMERERRHLRRLAAARPRRRWWQFLGRGANNKPAPGGKDVVFEYERPVYDGPRHSQGPAR